MICYDLLLAPLVPKLPAQPPRQPDVQPSQQQQQQQQANAQAKVQQPSLSPSSSFGRERGHSRGASPAAVAAAATELLQIAAAAGRGSGGGAGGGSSSSAAIEPSPEARRRAVKLKLQRVAVAAAAVVLYVKARSWLAGDQVRGRVQPLHASLRCSSACCCHWRSCRHHCGTPCAGSARSAPPLLHLPPSCTQLVRIYRKVENPIPFAPAAATRALTTGHLHARYAWLLLWPLRLSGAPRCAAARGARAPQPRPPACLASPHPSTCRAGKHSRPAPLVPPSQPSLPALLLRSRLVVPMRGVCEQPG